MWDAQLLPSLCPVCLRHQRCVMLRLPLCATNRRDKALIGLMSRHRTEGRWLGVTACPHHHHELAR
jgi:hypothetical protein